MFVELIESLRCPRDHAESPLVVASKRADQRNILEGILGCPVCAAEFPITNGVAQFAIPARPTPPMPADPQAGLRIAAFLELTDARGFALLCGSWGSALDGIQRVVQTALLLINPPAHFDGDPAGVIVCDDRIPLAAGAARAAAIDGAMSPALIASAVHAVRDGGRVVGSSAMTVPPGVAELTRDDTLWVGERSARHVVQLKRAPEGPRG